MLVTFGICFKQHFDTRYLVFYNPSPPRMFLSLDLLWEYRFQHGANRPLNVTSRYSTWIFCRGVSGFVTDCPCGVWCRGLTTCLLHIGPTFGNRILNKLGCRVVGPFSMELVSSTLRCQACNAPLTFVTPFTSTSHHFVVGSQTLWYIKHANVSAIAAQKTAHIIY